MISRHLNEPDIRVAENRLTKNLMELNIDKVKENYFQFVIKDLAKLNPHILVDETDVIKPYGIVFEGLSFIHDASKEGMKMILGHAKGRPPISGRNHKKKIEQLSLF